MRSPCPRRPDAHAQASAVGGAPGLPRSVPLGPSHVFFRHVACHSLAPPITGIPRKAENRSTIVDPRRLASTTLTRREGRRDTRHVPVVLRGARAPTTAVVLARAARGRPL